MSNKQGNDKEVEKPLVIKQKELVDALTAEVNNSGLPAFIVEPLLHNLWLEANASMQKEYASSLQYYQSMCKDSDDLNE